MNKLLFSIVNRDSPNPFIIYCILPLAQKTRLSHEAPLLPSNIDSATDAWSSLEKKQKKEQKIINFIYVFQVIRV